MYKPYGLCSASQKVNQRPPLKVDVTLMYLYSPQCKKKGGVMRVLLIALSTLVFGCSTAGPFVTNVSSSGPNKLLIEKCQVELNAFIGYVTNKNCTSNTIELQK